MKYLFGILCSTSLECTLEIATVWKPWLFRSPADWWQKPRPLMKYISVKSVRALWTHWLSCTKVLVLQLTPEPGAVGTNVPQITFLMSMKTVSLLHELLLRELSYTDIFRTCYFSSLGQICCYVMHMESEIRPVQTRKEIALQGWRMLQLIGKRDWKVRHWTENVSNAGDKRAPTQLMVSISHCPTLSALPCTLNT